jgi:hypothetical protein
MREDQIGVAKEISEYSDDSVAEMIDAFTREAEHYRRLAFGARQELLARLLERGATVFDGAVWQGKVKPGAISHTVADPERLFQRLSDFLQVKELALAFFRPEPQLRCNHAALNQVDRRGGDISRILAEERVSIRGDATLELTRKEERA